mgnify:CR=1 FL=1
MENYLTTGQIARQLRISISTLKRWINAEEALPATNKNASGWRLFSGRDLETLKRFKRTKKKNGKRFQTETLTPVLKA